jgi:hypothetical protein
MSAPVIAAAIDPVDIDPGVAYTYVIPVTGETSMGYTPDANFTIAIAGRVLTVTYIGLAFAADTNLSVSFFASNADGTTTQTLTFRIKTSSVYTPTSFPFTVAVTGTSCNFGSAIGSKLRPGDFVSIVNNAGTAGGNYYVASVSGSTFTLSATYGGAAASITADSYTLKQANISIYGSSSPLQPVFYADTSLLVIGAQIKIGSKINPVRAAFTGVFYVKHIWDAWHFTVSSTAGGAELTDPLTTETPTTLLDLFDDWNIGGTVLTFSGAGGRQVPKITTGSFLSANPGDAIDETLTADISFDESFALGLPTGLSLAANHIAGSVAAAGYYPIILELRKGANVSKRYLVLTVAAGAVSTTAESSLSGRRVALSLQSGLVMESASARRNVNPLAVALGDGPLVVDIVDGAIQPAGSTPGTLQFGAKAMIAAPGSTVDWDGDFIVFGSVDVTDVVAAGTQQTLVPNEDWSADDLLALFDADQDLINLGAQFRWRNGDTPAGKWYRSRPFQVSVSDTIFRDDIVAVPSALFVQTTPFTLLTGGTGAALDSAPTVGLATDRWLAVAVRTISGARSKSEWYLIAWDGTTAAAGETTSADRGIVIPTDFNSSTNAKMWVRVDGL